MTKQINEYTVEELYAKINVIKAERERTANALKQYEEELERRTCNIPLGVPVYASEKNVYILDIGGTVINGKINPESRTAKLLSTFETKESAEKHAEMLLAWRKALVANAKDEPIDIKALLPLLKKGKVLYSPTDKKWKWVDNKTSICPENYGWFLQGGKVVPIEGFNLKPAENWEESLMDCGL